MKRFLVLAAALAACRPPAEPHAADAPTKWLCRPDVAANPCRAADLTVTDLRPDGTRVVVPFTPAANPKVDCFYVYPTVDLDLVPGNHLDLTDPKRQRETTLAQAGRFQEACALWVPLYRQVTIGTYLQDAEEREKKLAVAYSDIDHAFREYLAQGDPSHRIVLIGHSQGAEMVIRILQRFFDVDPALRARLLLAMPIGGDVDVAHGTPFGTSKTVPPCTEPMQTGCLVAYRTYAAGEKVDPSRWAPPAGHDTVCVDPSALDHRGGHLAGAIFPSEHQRFDTPFIAYSSYFEAHCEHQDGGFAYLSVSAPQGDPRPSPFDPHDRRFRWGKLGLHILDLQLPQRDLVDLVARRAAGL